MRTKTQKGFTLIELMIVVAVMGILTVVAYPAYLDYVLRGKLTEATTQLSSMSVRLEQYYQDNTHYTGFDCTSVSGAQFFTYSCSPQTGDTYTAIATGIVHTPTEGFSYTLDQTGAKTTTVPSGSGWTGSTSCWVTKKGGIC